MAGIIDAILMIIFFSLFIFLIVGLIKPAKVMRWSKKPTRLKVLGWFLLSFVVIFISVQINNNFYTSEEHINVAKEGIAKGHFSKAIDHLKKIKKEDVLYAEAQTLLTEIDNLRLTEEANKKAIAEAKAAEKARLKAEADVRKKEVADAKAAEREAQRKANAEAKAAEDARKKELADAKAAEKAAEDARKKAEAETKAAETARQEAEGSLLGKWEPILKNSDGGNTTIEWIEFYANGTCKLRSIRSVERGIIGHSDKIFDGTWQKKQKENYSGIFDYIEIIYKYRYEYETKPVRIGTLNGQPWYDRSNAGKIMEAEKSEKYYWRDNIIYSTDNFSGSSSRMRKAN